MAESRELDSWPIFSDYSLVFHRRHWFWYFYTFHLHRQRTNFLTVLKIRWCSYICPGSYLTSCHPVPCGACCHLPSIQRCLFSHLGKAECVLQSMQDQSLISSDISFLGIQNVNSPSSKQRSLWFEKVLYYPLSYLEFVLLNMKADTLGAPDQVPHPSFTKEVKLTRWHTLEPSYWVWRCPRSRCRSY